MNTLYHVTYQSDPIQCPLVVRINGSEEYGLDRKKEVDFLCMLSGTQITFELVASFDNGIVYDFIHGDKMTKTDLEKKGTLR